MNYAITTYQNGKQLLGTDFTKIVKNCKSPVKLNNALRQHKDNLKRLENIKPYLVNGYTILINKY